MRRILFYFVFYVGVIVISLSGFHCIDFLQNYGDPLHTKYLHFSEELRLEMLHETKKMFYFGYDNYMSLAFPQDELNPIYCTGRGPDYDDPSNININDILGNFSLTLVDTLDALVVMGNYTEFHRAVQLVLDNVSFDQNTVIQVFEANIRLLGGLLSAHLLLRNPWNLFPSVAPRDYDNELLHLAHDLAARLLPAFERTETGIPHPRVHLRKGIPVKGSLETCTAGAGSLLVEFGILSRLLGDPVYENVARRASEAVWNLRHKATGLLGFALDISTGKWTSRLSGVGAGMDSYYEYLLKSSIILGHTDDLRKFKEAYSSIKQHMRRGRPRCNEGLGEHPLYVNVDMTNGAVITTWVDSLQASFAGVQLLDGDLEEAICSHAFYYALWKKYSALPERFNWQRKEPDVFFYPLRPEFVESTYFLYQATKNPFYLHVGRDIVDSLNAFAKAPCGYATLHSVIDKTQEDRMESFFLSETCKYLYLLFDTENPVNKYADRFIFTTEGHLIPLLPELRRTPWSDIQQGGSLERVDSLLSHEELVSLTNSSVCNVPRRSSSFSLPLKKPYLVQLFETMEVDL